MINPYSQAEWLILFAILQSCFVLVQLQFIPELLGWTVQRLVE
jgi:hypothetical protein